MPADADTLSLDEVGRRGEQAWALGASEVCMRGGHPSRPATYPAHFVVVCEAKKRVPEMHVHAFSPGGVRQRCLAYRHVDLGVAGRGEGVRPRLDPGAAAEILDDVRWLLAMGKLPAAVWIGVITISLAQDPLGEHDDGRARRQLGALPGPPAHALTQLGRDRRLHRVRRTAVHPPDVPIYLGGVAGTTPRADRAVHAMVRMLLHGRIDTSSARESKVGLAGCREVLLGEVNGLGGTLLDETIRRMAGSQHGSEKTVAQLRESVEALP